MPIYEFYCNRCNTVYKFLSKRVNTDIVPDCPACRNIKLSRQVSLFNTGAGTDLSDNEDGMMPGIDEHKMEKAMNMIAREAEGMNENDPRQATALMRKLSDAAGLKMSSNMEEALSRIEKGEDPEKVEQEMSAILENEEPFIVGSKSKTTVKKQKPRIDDRLYELK
ncbi:MAG: zinc ribbon domain-containing protein [Nitrospiraceae bacterium]|nr:MAG: zinc ribbon domain-containing protein [Nitrospiraceae bacterium]